MGYYRSKIAKGDNLGAMDYLSMVGGAMTFGHGLKSFKTTSATSFCFVAGTLVRTEDGLVPIEDIKKGDKVVSEDELTIQDEWANRNSLKDSKRNNAPAILLESESGSAHAYISAQQRERRRTVGYTSTLREEFDFSYRVMIDAGISKKKVRKAIKNAYKYFNTIEAIYYYISIIIMNG